MKAEGRRMKEEGRRQKAEGCRRKEEKDEGRRRKNEEDRPDAYRSRRTRGVTGDYCCRHVSVAADTHHRALSARRTGGHAGTSALFGAHVRIRSTHRRRQPSRRRW